MSCHDVRERLEEFHEGGAGDDPGAAIETHLEGCADCRRVHEELASLRRALDALPREIEPARDLWPGISSRLPRRRLVRVDFASRGASPGIWPRLRPAQWGSLAAAALLLMVASSGLTAWWVGARGVAPGDDAGAAGAGAPAVTAGLDSMEGEFAVAIDDLLWALYEGRDQLDPETVTVIETNLRVVDRAIRRARQALDEDPGNAALTRMLARQYQNKLDLLQRASRLIERS